MSLPPPDEHMPAGWRWVSLVLFGFVLALLMRQHVLWRDEVHAWQLAVYDVSLPSLFHNMSYDGHPALWFLLLRGLNALFHSPHAMPVAHWFLATANAFLILWYCPIPAWQRAACCFGYFMLFEFGVISRGYALELLIAFVFVGVHTRCRRAIALPALLLALLVHTTIPGAFIAFALLAYWTVESWREGRESRLRMRIPVVLVGISLICLVLYLKPPSDSFFANLYSDYRHHLTALDAIRNARFFSRVAIPVPRLDTIHFWNTNWADSIPRYDFSLYLQLAISGLCLILAILSFIHRPAVTVLLLTGTILLAGFSIIHGQTFLRHQGQWFILLLICYWLDQSNQDPNVLPFGIWQRHVARIFLAVVIAIQPVALLVAAERSFQTPFSSSAALMTQVMRKKPASSALAAFPEMEVSPVSFASGGPVYSPQADDLEWFTRWKDYRTDDVRTAIASASLRLAERVNNTSSQVVLCATENTGQAILSYLPANISVTPLARVPEGVVEGEVNVAYLLQKTP